jgi:hypothetical protein
LFKTLAIILVAGVRGGSKFATPYDSTIGVGVGFYWFAAVVILFLLFGTLKAFWDDKEWRGRYFGVPEKKKVKKMNHSL